MGAVAPKETLKDKHIYIYIYIYILKTNQFLLYRAKFTVYSETNTKHINTV